MARPKKLKPEPDEKPTKYRISQNHTKLTKDIDPAMTIRLQNGGFVTYEDRVAIATIYTHNKFNAAETARQLGIDERKVRAYYDQVGRNAIEEVNQERIKYMEEVHQLTGKAIAEKESEFISISADIKLSAVKRMKELVPECESIRDLATVVKVMHEVSTGKLLSDNESDNIDKKSKSVLMEVSMNILNNVTISNDGSK